MNHRDDDDKNEDVSLIGMNEMARMALVEAQRQRPHSPTPQDNTKNVPVVRKQQRHNDMVQDALDTVTSELLLDGPATTAASSEHGLSRQGGQQRAVRRLSARSNNSLVGAAPASVYSAESSSQRYIAIGASVSVYSASSSRSAARAMGHNATGKTRLDERTSRTTSCPSLSRNGGTAASERHKRATATAKGSAGNTVPAVAKHSSRPGSSVGHDNATTEISIASRSKEDGTTTATARNKSILLRNKKKKRGGIGKRTSSPDDDDDDDDASQASVFSSASVFSATYNRIKGYVYSKNPRRGRKQRKDRSRRQQQQRRQQAQHANHPSGRKTDARYRSKESNKATAATTGGLSAARTRTDPAVRSSGPPPRGVAVSSCREEGVTIPPPRVGSSSVSEVGAKPAPPSSSSSSSDVSPEDANVIREVPSAAPSPIIGGAPLLGVDNKNDSFLGKTDNRPPPPQPQSRSVSMAAFSDVHVFEEDGEPPNTDAPGIDYESVADLMGTASATKATSPHANPCAGIRVANNNKQTDALDQSKNAGDGTTQVLDIPWIGSDGSTLRGIYSGPVIIQPHGEGTLILDDADRPGRKFHGRWVNGELVTPLVDDASFANDEPEDDCGKPSRESRGRASSHEDSSKFSDKYGGQSGSAGDGGYTTSIVPYSYRRKRSESSMNPSPSEGIVKKSSFEGSPCKGGASLTSVFSECSSCNEDGSQQSQSDNRRPSRKRKYRLGDIAHTPRDMFVFKSNKDAMESASLLKKHDQAFLKRSDGLWTFAVIADRSFQPADAPSTRSRWHTQIDSDGHDKKSTDMVECMLFVINEDGATKIVKKRHWGKYVRRIRIEGEEYDER